MSLQKLQMTRGAASVSGAAREGATELKRYDADDFVHLKRGDEDKSSAEPTTAYRIPRMLSMALKGRGKSSVFKTTFWERFDFNTAANTAYNTIKNLQPKNVQDWSSISAIFDVARCTGVRLKTRLYATGGTATSACIMATGFDPGTGVVVSSVLDALSHEYNSGPIGFGNNYGNVVTNGVTASGFLPEWRAKTMQNFESGTISDLVGSNWFPVLSTVNAIVGYLTPYIEAAGSGVSVFGIHYIGYEMEFRYRH